MELVVDTSPRSSTVALAAHYFGLTNTQEIQLRFNEKENREAPCPVLRTLTEGPLTEPSVILKYLTTLLKKHIAEAVYSSKDALLRADIDSWLSFATEKDYAISDSCALQSVNSHLQNRTFFSAPAHLTLSDLAMFGALHNWMASSTQKDRLVYVNVARWFDHIQHLPGIFDVATNASVDPKIKEAFPAFVPIVSRETSQSEVPQIMAGAGKAQAKQTDTAASGGGQSDVPKKKENGKQAAKEKKKEKPQKPGTALMAKEKQGLTTNNMEDSERAHRIDIPNALSRLYPLDTPLCLALVTSSAPERPIEDPTRLEIRVGLVKKAWFHPDAERLYCEEVDIGETAPRQVASGLRDFIPLDQFEGQKVLLLANMKEKKLRGFPSHGMLLCGKSQGADGKEIVELVKPPADTPIGERVVFEGYSGDPDAVMTTKAGKDPFVAVQPGFGVSEEGYACYKGAKFMTATGPCKCDTLRTGSIS